MNGLYREGVRNPKGADSFEWRIYVLKKKLLVMIPTVALMLAPLERVLQLTLEVYQREVKSEKIEQTKGTRSTLTERPHVQVMVRDLQVKPFKRCLNIM